MDRGRLTFLLALLMLATLFPKPARGVEAGVPVYDVVLEVETRSDWTEVSLHGGFIADYNYTLSDPHRAVRYIRVSSTKVHLSKDSYNTSILVLRVRALLYVYESELKLTVTKGAIMYTSVKIYRGSEAVAAFNNTGEVPGNPDTNERTYSVPRDLLGEPDYTVQELDADVGKIVLAFYYPWYGNVEYGGRNSHWGSYSWRDINQSTHFPLLGAYDSRDPRVIRSHMRMAKCSGIDGFIVSWWGPESYEDKVFPTMLDVASKEGMKLTIYYESNRELTLDRVVEELNYVVRKYTGSGAFLKIDGKPVIFVYAVEARGRNVSFWRRVVERVEHDTGKDIYFVADTFNEGYLSVFDALHSYNLLSTFYQPREKFQEVSRIVRLYATRKELEQGERRPRAWIATVIPGFNNSKVGGDKIFPRDGGVSYKRFWDAAIGSRADGVAIVSWNEWHEGTEIEPSLEYGFKYLEITREKVRDYKGVFDRKCPGARLAEKGTDIKGLEGYAPIAWAIFGGHDVYIGGKVQVLDLNSTHRIAFLPGVSADTTYTVKALNGTKIRVTYWSLLGKKEAITFTYTAFSTGGGGEKKSGEGKHEEPPAKIGPPQGGSKAEEKDTGKEGDTAQKEAEVGGQGPLGEETLALVALALVTILAILVIYVYHSRRSLPF